MHTVPEDGPVLPVLIKNEDGTLIAAALQNTKAAKKSLEQGALWVVDSLSGRVLPWPAGGKLKSIIEGDFYNEAVCTAFDLSQLRAPSLNSNSEDKTTNTTSVDASSILNSLETLIIDRKKKMPEGSYTTHLFKGGLNKIKKKTGEEAVELILAEDPATITSEAADLLYHMTVLFVESGVPWQAVLATLSKR